MRKRKLLIETMRDRERRQTTTKPASYSHEAAAGLAAGVLGTIIGYPLDRVKTQFQLGKGKGGIFRTLLSLIRRGDIYKGVGPPLVSLSLLNSITFPTYSYFNTLYNAEQGWDFRHTMAACTVGPIAGTISTVENLVKTQVQAHNFKTSLECVRELSRKSPTLFYAGHMVNTLRESTFLMTYFSLYEGLRHDFIHRYNLPAQTAVPVAGGISGATAWFVSFPLDCVRAGVQAQHLDQSRTGAWQVLRSLLDTKGVIGLYHGVTPSLLRAFIVSGSRFTAYETTLWLLGEHKYD